MKKKQNLSKLPVHVHTLFLHYRLANNQVEKKLMQMTEQANSKTKNIELIKFINFSIQIKILLL